MSNAFASAAFPDDSDDDATKSLPSNASSLLRQRGRQREQQMNDPAKTLRKNVKFNSFTTATDREDGDLPPLGSTEDLNRQLEEVKRDEQARIANLPMIDDIFG